jgi:hypothetical protein
MAIQHSPVDYGRTAFSGALVAGFEKGVEKLEITHQTFPAIVKKEKCIGSSAMDDCIVKILPILCEFPT